MCMSAGIPSASRESKLRALQGPFLNQTRCFKDLYGKFHNADMVKIYYLNEETCTSKRFGKAHSNDLNDFCTSDEK